MIDLVAPRVPWPFVNEGDSFAVNVAYVDRDGTVLEAPSTVEYRVEDITNPLSPIAVRAWTTAAVGTTDSILIDSDDNAIISRANKSERRLLTVRANRDDTSQVSGQVRWTVRNQGFNP
jgi:hypothetical protein